MRSCSQEAAQEDRHLPADRRGTNREVLTGGVVGQIHASQNERFAVGEVVVGELGWQDYSVSNGKGLTVIDARLTPLSAALGVLGMPGLTAYFGLLDIGKPQPGETVVVSGAAGAVGAIVGQIAKIHGCRVVGIAGSDEKNEFLVNELGFDAAVNYKTETNLQKNLRWFVRRVSTSILITSAAGLRTLSSG